MKPHTPLGRKLIKKICNHCKHFRYKIDYDMEEMKPWCHKKGEDTYEFNTCDEFEFE